MSGFVAQRLTHRYTIIVSAISVGLIMLLLSCAQTFLYFQGLLFLTGLACGVYLPSGVSSLTSLLPQSHWGRGLAVHEMAPNISFVIAPAIAAWTLGLFSWRYVFAGIGLASITVGMTFFLWGQGGAFPGQAPHLSVITSLFRRLQFWILALLFGLTAGITFGCYSMLPLFLVQAHGFQESWANELVAFSRIPCLVLVMLSGLFVDKLGAKRTIVIALSVSGVLTLFLGMAQGPILVALVFAQPLLAVCYFPAGFTAISMCFPSKIRNVAVSFIIPFAIIFGTGFVPTLLGWFADQGLFQKGFTIYGGVVLLALSSLFMLSLEEEHSHSST
jgi:NNP family nitrate/nitrite transporter-like MFS transporter